MKLVPWNQITSWNCVRCGICCGPTTVQLTTQEWLKLIRMYGFGIVTQDVTGFYLRKTIKDQCPFLYNSRIGFVCTLQRDKPLACKLWPFRICKTPQYGSPNDAYFKYQDFQSYIYAYPQCRGVSLGKPSTLLIHKIIPEFINIRLGIQKKQFYSTSKISY